MILRKKKSGVEKRTGNDEECLKRFMQKRVDKGVVRDSMDKSLSQGSLGEKKFQFLRLFAM
jgi:hypothetical protein